MRQLLYICFAAVMGVQAAQAQGVHFSQYYNAPLLVNAANTALMSDNDYRVGGNYRTQWSRIPVPYKTFSAYADLKAFKSESGTNWLGIGIAFFNDIAGDGNLTLNKGDFSLAYHVQTNDRFMVSAGLSAGYASRTINYNKLYFGMQWDGFKFDQSLDNGESNINIIKTNYIDIGAGVNFSYFPNELVFIKFGAGFSHINQPKETFYSGSEAGTNVMAMRPSVNLDGTFIVDTRFTLNPSLYYSSQRGASQIVGGCLVNAKMTNEERRMASLIAGLHYRYREAMIGSIGLQYNGLRIMASYDYTMSSAATLVKNYGAMEFGVVFTGDYGERSRSSKSMNCPRFY